MRVGWIGTGVMGEPMALNLLRAGVKLVVWNRSAEKLRALIDSGAQRAGSVDELIASVDIVMLMLLNEQAIDGVLGRATSMFGSRVSGKTLVHMGTTSAAYSQGLARDVALHGGRYVEAPVSGSRGPAQQGALVGMTAGSADAVAAIRPLLAPLCARVFHCGEVPSALRMKLAVNHYLIATVVSLAEAFHGAQRAGLDTQVFADIVKAGPMASAVAAAKLDKLVANEFSPQAAIRDVAQIASLVASQAHEAGAHAPVIGTCIELFAEALTNGSAELDMAAVLGAIERRARG